MVDASHRESPLSNWSSASGVIKCLIIHVVSQKHVIEGSCKFLSDNLSWYVTILPSLMVIGFEVVEIFLVSHVI